ncbi:uncharacterized protein TRIVIDRAFT_111968 [Trichoderma virens Gv29-8]|uniref:Oxidase ustYa n=1 Tax=Hypocrea virens (strain Gv29-8 / FGSC 10586) TaxID=413071 RepID=G9MG57_HYPVG|nr:uncharacterized protein TRIVIDRAFT_111968 [Trichoderma virens Gv29-8]EHK26507.1 hypothetical protein TRIVIDRAFT_111968 [Trichoderma virens Gv29-8]UKZ46686.1 hypothetical protein TrVGV298_000893 [Trichoderma virens]
MSFSPLKTRPSHDESRDEEDVYTPPRKRNFRKFLGYGLLATLLPGWFVALDIYRHPRVVDLPGLSSPHPFPPQIFERVKKIFEPDERYIGPSNQTHHNWDHLVAGHDALYIGNPKKYGLMEGIGPPFHHENMAHPVPRKFYVVSLLHQMHCLNIVRFHYWQVKQGHPTVSEYSEASWDAHVDHCFEYLRQSISCGAGFSLEGHSPLIVEGEVGEASTVTGWGIEHNCINFEVLRAFQIEQERVYNTTWQR